MESKEYLGDGVYLELDANNAGTFLLTTENGIQVTNRIYLEADVLRKLLEVVREQNRRLNNPEENE